LGSRALQLGSPPCTCKIFSGWCGLQTTSGTHRRKAKAKAKAKAKEVGEFFRCYRH